MQSPANSRLDKLV